MRTIPLGILGICSSLLKCNSLKNGKLFVNFLFHLWNLHQVSNISKKKMIVIAHEFRKLQTAKDLVKPLSRNRGCRTCFDSQRVNGYEIFVKSAWEHFYHIFWSLLAEMICNISPLLKFEILGVFLNLLTACDKYAVGDRENLQFLIQTKFS